MRNFKRFLTLALAVLMVASVFTFGASAANFTDVDADNEYLADAVDLLAYVGVTKGTSETTFGTDDLVTREQMAAFIYRLMKKGNSVEGGANVSPFTDLEDETFFFMISWAADQGIVKGTSDTTFNPKGSITLQDAYTMIVRALGYEKEETLSYPHGYIEVAEGEDVELDEGLASDVTYTSALTRGDMAILLYNAFFAKTGVAETKQVEKLLGEGSGHETYVLVTETTYPTFCEKYFDVLEVEYQAVATPNYVFGESETTKTLGYDAVLFEKVAGEATEAPAQFYAAVEDLGLENADDYIMSHFTTYIKLDKDGSVDEILYAQPLMTVKTTNNIKFETLAGTNAAHYYSENVEYAKLLTGKAVVDGEAVYFYNAPYSYAKPTYTTGMSDSAKYDARNAKNPVFIEKAFLNSDEEAGEYAWSLSATVINDTLDVVNDEFFASEFAELVAAMPEAYIGGYYEADLYDVDGDGLYDYIDYKPYVIATVDTDEEPSDFFDTGVLYTGYEFATVEGEAADEDLVIAYINTNYNYAKIVEAVEAVEAEIVDIAANKGTITLDNDAKVDVKGAWKFAVDATDIATANYVVEDLVDGFTTFDALLGADMYGADAAKFYVYNGVLLAQDGITSTSKLDANIAIITAPKAGNIVETQFSAALGANTTYVYAWIDGELKYVPVEIDTDVTEIFPAITAPDATGYVDMLATYTVDKNGVYTFKMLGDAYNADSISDPTDPAYIGFDRDASVLTNTEDASLQVYGAVDEATFTKNIGKRFVLTDTDDDEIDAPAYNLIVGDNTKVIIKNVYNGKTTWYTLGAADLTASVVGTLTNIEYVVANNPDYTNREELLLLKAELNGAKFKLEGATVAKNQRIVKAIDVKKNADNEYYNVYTLLNPYTGETETGVVGSTTNTVLGSISGIYSEGDIVTLTGANVEEAPDTDADDLGNLISGVGTDNAATTGLYYVVDYDAELNFVEIVAAAGLDLTGDEAADIAAIEAGTAVRYSLDKATVTTIGKQQTAFVADLVKFHELEVIDAAKLDGSDKKLKAVNTAYADANGKLTTEYAKYLKIFVDFEDYQSVENGITGDINYAIVIANTAETDALDLD